jgi:hypothetical protein
LRASAINTLWMPAAGVLPERFHQVCMSSQSGSEVLPSKHSTT